MRSSLTRRLLLPLFFMTLAFARPALGLEPGTEEQQRLEALWDSLAKTDSAKAYQAIVRLAQTPKETTAFIKARLQPAAAPDGAKVKQWIADLSSPNFSVRSKANANLEKLAEL